MAITTETQKFNTLRSGLQRLASGRPLTTGEIFADSKLKLKRPLDWQRKMLGHLITLKVIKKIPDKNRSLMKYQLIPGVPLKDLVNDKRWVSQIIWPSASLNAAVDEDNEEETTLVLSNQNEASAEESDDEAAEDDDGAPLEEEDEEDEDEPEVSPPPPLPKGRAIETNSVAAITMEIIRLQAFQKNEPAASRSHSVKERIEALEQQRARLIAEKDSTHFRIDSSVSPAKITKMNGAPAPALAKTDAEVDDAALARLSEELRGFLPAPQPQPSELSKIEEKLLKMSFGMVESMIHIRDEQVPGMQKQIDECNKKLDEVLSKIGELITMWKS